MIETLFSKLHAMEQEGRFDGAAYPFGLEPFPRRLIGQGFFPGGDGLWREGDSNSLRSPSKCSFPHGGIMFLGNDFGSLNGFNRLGVHENPPTWRHLRQRLERAGIPGHLGFFTNAYMGLRTDRAALDTPISLDRYDAFCAEFLAFQIQVQQPRLIVVLGDRPLGLLRMIVRMAVLPIGQPTWGEIGSHRMVILMVTHPYSDLNKSEAVKEAEADALRKAWALSNIAR